MANNNQHFFSQPVVQHEHIVRTGAEPNFGIVVDPESQRRKEEREKHKNNKSKSSAASAASFGEGQAELTQLRVCTSDPSENGKERCFIWSADKHEAVVQADGGKSDIHADKQTLCYVLDKICSVSGSFCSKK